MITMTEKESLSASDPNQPSCDPDREGQLTLLGAGDVYQFRPPVCICTLTSDALRDRLMQEKELEGVVVGALHTENLGIEQIISYCVENPNIRFMILCGEDGKQAVGHLPGQSFLSLFHNGLDAHGVIVGAQGKRPVIRNLSTQRVAHFRDHVEVVDLIGCESAETILQAYRDCVARNPGVAPSFEEPPDACRELLVAGYVPERMQMDPMGYFVIYVESSRGVIRMEHYTNNGVFQAAIEGKTHMEVCCPAIERGWVSRLDHAAYLGRELCKAELALKSGHSYIQDAPL